MSLAGADRPLLMGILNVTPDSFSDGGRHFDSGVAVAHGLRMAQEGADIIDLGGESTRPGAARVSAADQLQRVLPVLKELCRQKQFSLQTLQRFPFQNSQKVSSVRKISVACTSLIRFTGCHSWKLSAERKLLRKLLPVL